MKVITRAVVDNGNGVLDIVEVDYLNYNFSNNMVMAIDGSTTVTGIAFADRQTGSLAGTMAIIRDKETESKVRFKVGFKKVIKDILDKFEIQNIYYEEPFIGYAEAAKALLMLRTSIEELIIESEPKYDYVVYKEVNNKKWKRLLLGDGNCPSNTELEKKAIREFVCKSLPFMDKVTQDEIDASGLVFVATTRLRGGSDEDLESSKKPTKFQYNIRFIGASDDEDMVEQLSEELDGYKVPEAVLSNGVKIVSVPGSGIFDNYIYKHMNGVDVLLVIGFSSKHHSNMAIRHRIGYLIPGNDRLYAVVWRKSRLKKGVT